MKSMPHIVLASSSPRRKAFMAAFAIPVTTHSSEIDEGAFLWNADIEEGTQRLALQKACKAQETYPTSLILGFDTVVVCNNKVYGKPKDRKQAEEFLYTFSGQEHKVITGCALITPTSQRTASETTSVLLHPLSTAQIDAYLQTNMWTDKAGGYVIQGPHGSLLVQSITGCYYNVLGIPAGTLNSLLEEQGISLWNHLPPAST